MALTFLRYSDHLKDRFGKRVYKAVVSSKLTCPTRDGSISKSGCAFCDVRGSSSFYGKQGRGGEIRTQLEKKLAPLKARFQADAVLAYFQSYTNTYGEVEYLRSIYTEALSVPGVVGLSIGTRPDCLPNSVIDLLHEISKSHYVCLELGVQSICNKTLEWLDRGHTVECSQDAIGRLKSGAPGVEVSVHFMFGAPTEDALLARKTAEWCNHWGVDGVKLHQLMVLENTELAKRYRNQPFQTLSMEEYAQRLEQFLSVLRPNCFVERLYATASHPDECIAPVWSRDRWAPHNFFRDYLQNHDAVPSLEPFQIGSEAARKLQEYPGLETL